MVGRERARLREDGACGSRGNSNDDHVQPDSARGGPHHDADHDGLITTSGGGGSPRGPAN